MATQASISLDVGALSLVATIVFFIINIYLNQSKQSKVEYISSEHRITELENNKLDRSCIVDFEKRINNIEFAISYKLNPLWAVIEHEIPKMLLKENTPELDRLLREVQNNGFDSMDMHAMKRLACMLDEEFQNTTKLEAVTKHDRVFGLVFLKAAVEGAIDERNHRPSLIEESGE